MEIEENPTEIKILNFAEKPASRTASPEEREEIIKQKLEQNINFKI